MINVVPGHGLLCEGAAHNVRGERPMGRSTGGSGYGKCSCGKLSGLLHSGQARRRWHKAHKAEVVKAGQPVIEPITAAPYLTIIPDRTPLKKLHDSLGQAQKAIVFRARQAKGLTSPCTVYEWDDAKGWELLWRFEAGTRKEDLPWH